MSLMTYLDPAGFHHDDTNGRSALQGALDPLNQDPLGLYEEKTVPMESQGLGNLNALLEASQASSSPDHERNAQIMNSILQYALM